MSHSVTWLLLVVATAVSSLQIHRNGHSCPQPSLSRPLQQRELLVAFQGHLRGTLRGGEGKRAVDPDAAKFMRKVGMAPTKNFFRLADKDDTGRVTLAGAREAAEEIYRQVSSQDHSASVET